MQRLGIDQPAIAFASTGEIVRTPCESAEIVEHVERLIAINRQKRELTIIRQSSDTKRRELSPAPSESTLLEIAYEQAA
jgi:hypothetical protein